jgi:siroheme synthase-like protein
MASLHTNYYVACIDLQDERALVVGGGDVALEKIEGLLLCGAHVIVVSQEPSEEIQALARDKTIELRERPYEPGDLDRCLLVVVATSDETLNLRVSTDAEALSMLVNVADVPALCNFILPAIVREPPLAIAISTGGASPALAQRMKREVASSFGPAYARLAQLLHDVRPWAKEALATYADRKRFFDDIVNGEPDPIALLLSGDESSVVALIGDAQRRAEKDETGS